MSERLKLHAVADKSLAWRGGDSVRHVVATLTASAAAPPRDAPPLPVHLGIVIDASGSMAGEKLADAKKAALGVADRLRDGDRLSIVSFASDTIVHVSGAELTRENRASIRAAVNALGPRGNTNLSDGWLSGAECVASAIDGPSVNRVVLLSDGQANAGILNPDELATHAAALAKGGVLTSCVGIGDDYEFLTLRAIAESGGGRLHEAPTSAEIVEALLGEFQEIGLLAAQDVSVTLHVPATAKAALVGSAPVTVGAGTLTVFAGALLAAAPRAVVFRLTLPSGKADETLLFGVTARGVAPAGEPLEAKSAEIAFTFVEGERNNAQARNGAAASTVARAWHAEITREAARLNRAGERRQARAFVERELALFERYCAALGAEAAALVKEIVILKQHVGRDWDERTRKDMEFAAYSVQSAKTDYRRARAGWAERMQGEK
jgi:Ca-activated chloride channel family protein